MKRVYFFVFSFLFMVACNNDFEQEAPFWYGEKFPEELGYMNMPRPDDSYNYPIYPGTDAWAKLTSGEERLAVLQIPKKIASKMSTQALIQAMWEYPLLFEALCFFSSTLQHPYQSCFDFHFSTNNAHVELVHRTDAGDALLYRLERVIPFTRLETQTLMLMVSQSCFLDQLNIDKKRKLVEIAFHLKDVRYHDPLSPFYGHSDQFYDYEFKNITYLLLGRTMFSAYFDPFVESVQNDPNLKAFLDGNSNYRCSDFFDCTEMKQYITDCSKKFINEK